MIRCRWGRWGTLICSIGPFAALHLFLAWFTKCMFWLHAIPYRTSCLAWWLTNPMLAMFGMEAFQRDFEGIPFLRFCWRHGAFGMEECNLPYVPMESFARLHKTFGIAFRGNVFPRWRWVRGKRETAAVSVVLDWRRESPTHGEGGWTAVKAAVQRCKFRLPFCG